MVHTIASLRARSRTTPEGCWFWEDSVGGHGYGTVRHDGETVTVHRLAWRLAMGAIPPGLCVLHHCDVRRCFNPAHLFLGTLADNNADMFAKGRGNLSGLTLGREFRGERHGAAKLTEVAVREIKSSREPGRALAHRFGVAEQTICNIRKGRRWAHVVV